MMRRTPLLFAVGIAAVALFATFGAAHSSSYHYPEGSIVANATLAAPSGQSSKGKGKVGLIVYDNYTLVVTVNLTGALNEILAAHIHVYEPAEGNPILVGLLPVTGTTSLVLLNPPLTYKGSFSFVSVIQLPDWDELKDYLYDKKLYVNIHTKKYPGGEIQGYLYCKYGCDYSRR